ncbi:alpha/beta hydrolase [Candidatus Dependentiae bacterium]|nr:alpha/beta hydrolase [Candidatus Dependentiae bacterium]
MKMKFFAVALMMMAVSLDGIPPGKLCGVTAKTPLVLATKQEKVELFAQRCPHSREYIRRHGILVLRPRAKATILVMHGYTCDKVDVGFMRLIFPEYNLLLFDFRAHGEDIEGQCSTMGRDEIYDIFAAIDYLRSHPSTKDLPIIGWGFSMGASTAIVAQATDPTLFKALILDCPFDSSLNLIKRGMDKLRTIRIPLLGYEVEIPGRHLLEQYAFHEYVQPVVLFFLRLFARMDATRVSTVPKAITPQESIKKVTIPCYFVTCVADDRVPFDAVYADYMNAAGIKRLWLTKGKRHFGSIFHNPELYKEVLNQFISDVLTGDIAYQPHEQVFSEVSYERMAKKHAQLYVHELPDECKRLLLCP